MLSQAVLEAAGGQNPVAIAAEAHGFSSESEFLRDVGTKSGATESVIESFVGAYEQTRASGRPQIPYFAIKPIEHSFSDRLAEVGTEARAKRQAKPKASRTTRNPPRQCPPARR